MNANLYNILILFLSSITYVTLAGLLLSDVNLTEFKEDGIKQTLTGILWVMIVLSLLVLFHCVYLIMNKKEIGKFERFFMFLYQLIISVFTFVVYFVSRNTNLSNYPNTSNYLISLGSISGGLSAITAYIHFFDCNC